MGRGSREDEGKVGEFANPQTLMKQKTSMFKDLVMADQDARVD